VGKVILSLDDIETCYAWFLNTIAGVFNRCLLEIVDQIRLDVNVNMDDEHDVSSFDVNRFGS